MSEYSQFDAPVEDDTEVEDLLDTDSVDEAPAATEEAAPKEKKAKAEPKRGDLPAGYVTPIGLTRELNERNLCLDKNGDVKVGKPQETYSYINNAPKEHPFPLVEVEDSVGTKRSVVLLEEGIAWWEAKNARTAERRANAQAKREKKATKDAAKAEEPAVAVTEDENVDLSEFEQAE
jgi:hypothetical protein